MNYGQYFKKARNDCGYTQKEVAKELKIHQSNVSDWENDVSRPEYEKLIELDADVRSVERDLLDDK